MLKDMAMLTNDCLSSGECLYSTTKDLFCCIWYLCKSIWRMHYFAFSLMHSLLLCSCDGATLCHMDEICWHLCFRKPGEFADSNTDWHVGWVQCSGYYGDAINTLRTQVPVACGLQTQECHEWMIGLCRFSLGDTDKPDFETAHRNLHFP